MDRDWLRRTLALSAFIGELIAGPVLITSFPEQAGTLVQAWIVTLVATAALGCVPANINNPESPAGL